MSFILHNVMCFLFFFTVKVLYNNILAIFAL